MAPRLLFRFMKKCTDAKPRCGDKFGHLGVRVPPACKPDVIPDPTGIVSPGVGGLSVAPDDPKLLPLGLLPPEMGGTYLKDDSLIYGLNIESLGVDLLFRPDSMRPEEHGFVEPSSPMHIDRYQDCLCGTRISWDPCL